MRQISYKMLVVCVCLMAYTLLYYAMYIHKLVTPHINAEGIPSKTHVHINYTNLAMACLRVCHISLRIFLMRQMELIRLVKHLSYLVYFEECSTRRVAQAKAATKVGYLVIESYVSLLP